MKNDIKRITETTIDAMEEEWLQAVNQMDLDSLKNEILKTIKELKVNVELFKATAEKVKSIGRISVIEQRLELKKDMIYKTFFRLQNLINAYEGQRIRITYVHTDDNGRKEIRLYDNNASDLEVRWSNKKYGRNYQKLTYVMSDTYTKLNNALPEETNEHLQSTAQEVEKRFENNRNHIVYWNLPGRSFAGYRFINKGPINEAFVNFYVNTKPKQDYFNQGTEKNVYTYVMHKRYGAIAADTQNGFLVGDVSTASGIQYAVKGDFASPQGYSAVLKALSHLEENASHHDLRVALQNFRMEALNKTQPLIHEATSRQLKNLLKKLEGKK